LLLRGEKEMTNYLRLKKMLYMVSLASISIVLALIEIPWFIPTGPFAGFLKLDFSEVAILVSLYILGTKETIGVILIRTIARRLFRSFEVADMVGELLAMFASFSIIVGYNMAKSLLKDKEKPLLYEVSVNGSKITKKEWVVYTAVISTMIVTVMFLINFLVATPIYLSLFGVTTSRAIRFNVISFVNDSPFTFSSFLWANFASYSPFNLVKGVLVTVIFLTIKPRLKYLEL
jgi:riboflavin transporter FmnP